MYLLLFFIRDVPKKLQEEFVTEGDGAVQRMAAFKDHVRNHATFVDK